jgi:hypothetical protein
MPMFSTQDVVNRFHSSKRERRGHVQVTELLIGVTIYWDVGRARSGNLFSRRLGRKGAIGGSLSL